MARKTGYLTGGMIKGVILTGIIFILLYFQTFLSFAGEWRRGEVPNEERWRYSSEDGSYLSDGWFWLDGNGDGTSESYCFDREGWMLSDTVTSDGYTINADGAWVENGVIGTGSRKGTKPQAQIGLGYIYLKPEKMDYVIASLHATCIQAGNRAENTSALVNAMKNSHVKIIGRREGLCRMLNRIPGWLK